MFDIRSNVRYSNIRPGDAGRVAVEGLDHGLAVVSLTPVVALATALDFGAVATPFELVPGVTTDHVVPRALGGRDSWTNLVCACIRCNNRKGNRSPEQAGMSLARPPRAPHRYMQITFYTPIPDKRWRPYLFLD